MDGCADTGPSSLATFHSKQIASEKEVKTERENIERIAEMGKLRNDKTIENPNQNKPTRRTTHKKKRRKTIQKCSNCSGFRVKNKLNPYHEN